MRRPSSPALFSPPTSASPPRHAQTVPLCSLALRSVRDYIHVVDLAKGHLAALAKLDSSPGCVVYNLGTGTGYSVLEMLAAYSKVSPHQQIPHQQILRQQILRQQRPCQQRTPNSVIDSSVCAWPLAGLWAT